MVKWGSVSLRFVLLRWNVGVAAAAIVGRSRTITSRRGAALSSVGEGSSAVSGFG
jgi:hypothetical protein